MPAFARIWRVLERTFPPSGPRILNPNEVSDDVVLVHDILRPSFKQAQTQLFSDFQIVATGGATTQVLVPEPPPGLILFPVYWAVSYDGAANIRVDSRVIVTASAADPWGDWIPTGGVGGNQDIGHVRASASIFVRAPAIPVPRRNQLRATFNAPAAVTNVASNFYGVLVPGELAGVEMWKVDLPNMTWTVALP